MACTSHTNSCPTHPGYDPPLSAPVWTNDPIGTDDPVEDTDFNEIASYLNTEFTRRSISPSAAWTNLDKTKSTDEIIYSADYKILRDAARKLNSTTWPSNNTGYMGYGALAKGVEIQDESTEALRTRVAELRAECLCDCNYTCTCDCNYCVCNCNHSCQCNCNYSDRKLKTNIKYI